MVLQGFTSPPVRLDLIDLALDRTAAAPAEPCKAAATPQPVPVPPTDAATCAPAASQAKKKPSNRKQGANPAATSQAASLKRSHKECSSTETNSALQIAEMSNDKKGSRKQVHPSSAKLHLAASGHAAHLTDSDSQVGLAGEVADPAVSRTSQPACQPDTEDAAGILVPSAAAQISNLPLSRNKAKKPARARHKVDGASHLRPVKKGQKAAAPEPADAGPSRTSSLSVVLGSYPGADSDVASCLTQAGRGDAGRRPVRAGKPRKNMSLNAASLDTSLDKSPVQATCPTRAELEEDDVADDAHINGHAPGRDSSLPANVEASCNSVPAQADPDPSQPQPSTVLRPTDSEGLADVTKKQRSGVASKPVGNGNGSKASLLSKRYGSTFIWGQLSGWFKQTVYDPTASLSAERRGTISLPDIESCYGTSKQRYNAKVGSLRT